MAMRWLSILAVAACTAPMQPPPLSTQCTSQTAPLETNVLAGQMSTVKVGLTYQCGFDPTHATGVTISVAGPDGGAVDHSESDFQADWNDSVEVTFLPAQPGTYRISANFTGTASTEVDVAAVVLRSDAPRVVTWSPTTQCGQLDVTDQGTVVCLRQGNFGRIDLVTLRGDALSAIAFALNHDVLWRLSRGDDAGMVLDRMIDDGTTFQVTHTASRPALKWPLAPQGTDVVLFDGALVRAHPESDGGLSLDRIAIPVSPDALATGADGGVLVWSDPSKSRPVLVQVPGAMAVFGAPMSNNVLQGVASDAIFVETETFAQQPVIDTRFRLTAIRSTAQASAPFPQDAWVKSGDLQMGPYPPIVAMTGYSYVGLPPMPPVGRQTLPVFDGAVVTFETFDVGAGYDEVTHVTASHAFALASDGTSLKIFDR
jgi:hypothetical protein